jgi:hypothetical protein
MTILGTKYIREAVSEFTTAEKNETGFTIPLNNLDPKITFTTLDNYYHYTSWDNWLKILEVLNPIAQNFQWQEELFDCDNRSNLMSTLCSLFFRINTCATVYCEVYAANGGTVKYLHYANLIADDAGNLYLWDVDCGGITQKITTNNVVMGNNRYKLLSVRGY